MSKLATAIRAAPTNKRFAHNDYTYTESNLSSNNYFHSYTVGVELKTSAYVDNTQGDLLTTTIEQCKRALIEEAFGEFRSPIHSIRVALFQRDVEKALDLLYRLEEQMFNVKE